MNGDRDDDELPTVQDSKKDENEDEDENVTETNDELDIDDCMHQFDLLIKKQDFRGIRRLIILYFDILSDEISDGYDWPELVFAAPADDDNSSRHPFTAAEFMLFRLLTNHKTSIALCNLIFQNFSIRFDTLFTPFVENNAITYFDVPVLKWLAKNKLYQPRSGTFYQVCREMGEYTFRRQDRKNTFCSVLRFLVEKCHLKVPPDILYDVMTVGFGCHRQPEPAVDKDRLKGIEYLIQHKADVNAPSRPYKSLLACAHEKMDLGMIECLVKHGVILPSDDLPASSNDMYLLQSIIDGYLGAVRCCPHKIERMFQQFVRIFATCPWLRAQSFFLRANVWEGTKHEQDFEKIRQYLCHFTKKERMRALLLGCLRSRLKQAV